MVQRPLLFRLAIRITAITEKTMNRGPLRFVQTGLGFARFRLKEAAYGFCSQQQQLQGRRLFAERTALDAAVTLEPVDVILDFRRQGLQSVLCCRGEHRPPL